MTPLANIVGLSLLAIRAARRADIDPIKAIRFLDELVALPDEAAERVVAERRHEALRRANAKNVRKAVPR